LYDFDRKLRLIIFDAIGQIEVALRAQIIYQYALDHGSHWYLNSQLFKDPGFNKKKECIDYFQTFQDALSNEIFRNRRDPFISHYEVHYSSPSSPPCWMGLEVLSFGSLSKKLYSNLKDNDCKRKVADFFNMSPSILESWLNHITVVRNACAHHSRLWNNRKLPRISGNSKYYISFQGFKNICISV